MPVLQKENLVCARVPVAIDTLAGWDVLGSEHQVRRAPLWRSTFKINGPGTAFQPFAPSMGLQARLSPSFFSRMRGVTLLALLGPFNVTGGALLAAPANTALLAIAVSAVLMEHLLGSGIWGSDHDSAATAT